MELEVSIVAWTAGADNIWLKCGDWGLMLCGVVPTC